MKTFEEVAMFYENLLIKYINFLNDIEGSDFIDQIGNRMHDVKFTKEEHELLIKLKDCFYTEIKTTHNIPNDIRDEMDSDMEDAGMSQGEIESCLIHWGNKYNISRKN